MRVALLQSELAWENPDANRTHFHQILDTEEADLFVLPEMFSSGFTMNPSSVAETRDGETARWMQDIARKKNAALTGSLVVEENGSFYNRLLFVFPDGKIQQYDKRHLFGLAGEDTVYGRGSQRLIVDFRGVRICPLVCYDLRFPVFSRNTDDFDLLLYVANWPRPRIEAWDALLKARAIENVCYAAGVNRVGQDANGHDYPGHSNGYDFSGKVLSDVSETETVVRFTIEKEKLQDFRRRFPFLDDQDRFTLGD